MRRITGLLLGLLVSAGAGSATAQVDCTGGCTDTKYGFGFKEDYRRDEFPPDIFRWSSLADFGPDFPGCVGGPTAGAKCSSDAECGAGGSCVAGASYFVTRTSLLPNFGGSCGPERQIGPLPGMVILREQTSCVPTSTGPTCAGGANAGQGCHLNPPPAIAAIECPASTCQDNGGGCRLEIPLETADGGVSPTENTSEVKVYTTVVQARNPFTGNLYNLTAQTGNTLGGTSDDSNPICPITNIRRKPSMATRYLLPENRRLALGLPAGATYIRFDSAHGITNPTGAGGCGTTNEAACNRSNLATNFRLHTDDTSLCCKPNVPGDCSALLQQASAEYPLLTGRTCSTTGRPFVVDDNIVADWVFVGGRGTAFSYDPNYVNPGQIPGVCRNNRFQDCYVGFSAAQCSAALNPYACCTGAGQGNCTDPCASLDANPETPELEPDSCDLREGGAFRVQVACARDSEGNTRRDCCPGAMYALRGMPDRGCTLLPRMEYNGDPGKDCAVTNYGVNHRYDDNCDGVEDNVDLCPFFAEWEQGLDSNGDCPGPACRGDECECGDVVGGTAYPPGSPFLSGNGLVTVSDLAAINLTIFNPQDPTKRSLLADTNNDIDINVSDLVGTNIELFRPDSSVCRHITPRQCGAGIPQPCCGDGVITTGEACDDGNLLVSDGCNGACRVEFGFTCDNDPPPSTCAANP